MRYEEIPKQEWLEHCESFGRQHHGWRVTLRRADTAAIEYDLQAALSGAEILAAEQPLQAVRLDPRRQQVEVEVGEGERQRFQLEGVRRIWRERVGEVEEGIRFDDGKGHSLLVEFRVPMPPEALDGLAETER